MYRATRGGEEIYSGGVDGLLEAARNGQILANDLIFDPTVEKWIFARSLSVLAGFPLKGRRSGSSAAVPTKTRIVLNESTLKERNRRRRAVVRVAGLALVLTSMSFLILQIPSRQEGKTSEVDELVTGDTSSRMKIEGTGKGLEGGAAQGNLASNMDDLDVVIDGVHDESASSTSSGRRAEFAEPKGDQGMTKGQQAPGAGQPSDNQLNQSESDADGVGALGPTAGANGATNVEGQRTTNGRPFRHRRLRERKIVDLPVPRVSSPESSGNQNVQTSQGRTIIRERIVSTESVNEELDEVRSVLTEHRRDESTRNGRTLLQARTRAQRLHRYLNAQPEAATLRKEAELLMKQLTKAFQALCEEESEPEFCALKSQHPSWPDVVVRSVSQKRVLVGMNQAQVQAAWGQPTNRLEAEKASILCFDSECARSVRMVGEMVVDVRERVVNP